MAGAPQDLIEHGKELYGRSVNQALAGFQLIEEMLKTYLEMHFDQVRALLKESIYFEFRRQDYQDAALGRLTQVFSKLCPNQDLVRDLRAVVRRRDHLAHRALLKLYEGGIEPNEYLRLIDEVQIDMSRNKELMSRIANEMSKLVSK